MSSIILLRDNGPGPKGGRPLDDVRDTVTRLADQDSPVEPETPERESMAVDVATGTGLVETRTTGYVSGDYKPVPAMPREAFEHDYTSRPEKSHSLSGEATARAEVAGRGESITAWSQSITPTLSDEGRLGFASFQAWDEPHPSTVPELNPISEGGPIGLSQVAYDRGAYAAQTAGNLATLLEVSR